MAADPGWKNSWKSVPMMVVPQIAIRRAAREPNSRALIALRSLFVAVSTGMSIAIVVGAGCNLSLMDALCGST